MRVVPSDLATKISKAVQTRENGSDPSAVLWIGRPTTALTNKIFLERQTVLNAAVTDTSIAVCHPHFGTENTKVYIAYISGGVAHVVTAASKTKMSNHIWIDTGFSETASAVSIAYDGTMPKNSSGDVEFVTEDLPWIFWANSGVLYARKLGSTDTVTLAQANCTDVSAIRAMWSEVGGFDFGLIAFFILSGVLYYRQLINGEWADAETVSYGPSGAVWTNVAAFRTWDYRVGVQLKGSDGNIFELFTQFMGVGKQNVEHINVADISADSDLIKVNYHNVKTEENIRIADISAVSLTQWGSPVYAVSAQNIANSDSDWGRLVVAVLDHPCNTGSVSGNDTAFTLTDSNNVIYYSSSVAVSSDGLTLTIGFTDFNAASGDCTLAYIPGTIKSPPVTPDTAMIAWTKTFTPTGLVPPKVDPPVVVEVTNI